MRVYEGKYLSVTSIIDLRQPFKKQVFENWCKANGLNSTSLGSSSRVMGEKLGRYLFDYSQGLRGLSEPLVGKVEYGLREGADKFLNDWEILKCEEFVKCDELHYAGTYDGLVKNIKTGQEVLVDFKTFGAWKSTPYKRDPSKIKKTRWQVSLYSHAMGWSGELGVVVFGNDGHYEIELLKFDKGMLEFVENNQELILDKIRNEKDKQV